MAGKKETTPCKVVYGDEDRTNLLGLIIGDVIQRSLADPEQRKRCGNLKGDVELHAGKMAVNLSFRGDEVVVSRNRLTKGKPKARVTGDLHSFSQVALGRKLFGPYLKGRVKVAGNVYFLLKMLPLLRAR